MAAKPKRSCGGRKISKRPMPFFKLKLNKRNKILDSKVWIQRHCKTQFYDRNFNVHPWLRELCKKKQEPNLLSAKREFRSLAGKLHRNSVWLSSSKYKAFIFPLVVQMLKLPKKIFAEVSRIFI